MIKKAFAWLKETFGDTWAIKFIEKMLFSLDNTNKGLSGKKLTAMALTYCVIKLHEYYGHWAFFKGDFSLLPVILGADFGFLALLFGINEYSKKKSEQPVATETATQTDSTS